MNKEPKDAVIITHSGDPDGIISAAFIADFLASKSVNYELRFADYPNLTEVMETAANENGKSFYILDLGLSQTELPDEIMMPMLKNNDVHYFDHHEIEVKRRNLLREKCKTFVSKNEELCTAKLIVEHYKFEETDHEVLSDCAQTTDYYGSKGPELTGLGTELAKAISLESGLAWENIVQTIRKGLNNRIIWRNGYNLTGELAKGAAMTQMAMDAAMPQFTDSASCHELFESTDSITIAAITMSDNRLNILSGMFGYILLKQKYPDAHVFFVLYESGSVFAGPGEIQNQSQAHILPFLIKQGGGGRDGMGGFRYETPTNVENYKERRDLLLQEFKSFLEQNYNLNRPKEGD